MHVLVNAAVSVDGKLASRRREQLAISGEADFARVDRLRAESDAIVVGVGTVLADDPSLVCHDESHRAAAVGDDVPPPARVVVDSRCRTPIDADILDGAPVTYVLTSEAAPETRQSVLREAGATVVVAGDEQVDLPVAFDELALEGIERVLVEGGGTLIFSLFEDGLVDELSVFVGGLLIGGSEAPTLADGDGFVADFPELEIQAIDRLDDGVVLTWRVA